MNYARSYFGLTAIEDRLYATGGEGLSASSKTSVESFSHETGWGIKDTMELPSPHNNHCSVALGTQLVVLGGSVPVLSNSVHASAGENCLFDISSEGEVRCRAFNGKLPCQNPLAFTLTIFHLI